MSCSNPASACAPRRSGGSCSATASHRHRCGTPIPAGGSSCAPGHQHARGAEPAGGTRPTGMRAPQPGQSQSHSIRGDLNRRRGEYASTRRHWTGWIGLTSFSPSRYARSRHMRVNWPKPKPAAFDQRSCSAARRAAAVGADPVPLGPGRAGPPRGTRRGRSGSRGRRSSSAERRDARAASGTVTATMRLPRQQLVAIASYALRAL